MSFSAETSAIQERILALRSLIREIHNEHIKNEHNIISVNKFQNKIKIEKKLNSYHKNKLKLLYTECLKDTEKEEELLRRTLEKIYEIRSIRLGRRIAAKHSGNKETIRRGTLMKLLQTSAQTLPLWVGKVGEKPPPLCGCLPADSTYIARTGDMVAALVKGLDEDENWILAEVVHWHPSTNKYEVDDIDEEQKDRHMLSRRKIIPLPLMRANPETNKEALFPKGATGKLDIKYINEINEICKVMALYPQTTCFYKAIINNVPYTAVDEYEVLFEDASYSEGYSPPLAVPQKYVIHMKEKKIK